MIGQTCVADHDWSDCVSWTTIGRHSVVDRDWSDIASRSMIGVVDHDWSDLCRGPRLADIVLWTVIGQTCCRGA